MNVSSMTQTINIDSSFLMENARAIDLTKILREAIRLNGLHDQKIQEEISLPLLSPQHSWVITQYQIQQIKELPLNSQLEIKTMIIDLNAFFVTRRHQISDGQDLYYELYTRFAAIDLDKRRIARLSYDKEKVKIFVNSNFPFKFSNLSKIESDQMIDRKSIVIEQGDIDGNKHVNNLVYLRWAYQALIKFISDSWSIDKVYVKYEKEILPEDQVEIQTSLNSELGHSQQIIYNLSQNTVASIIEIHWNRNED